MSLSRAEVELIQFIEDNSKEAEPSATFLAELEAYINKGIRLSGEDARIRWGSAAFSKTFNQRLIATSLISETTLVKICNELLDKKTFEGAPLREVHLFSHLYGELLKRHVDDLVAEPPRLPESLHLLNGKILHETIKIFDNSKKRGEEATFDCANNFLYMRFPELKIPEEKHAQIQTVFFDDIKSHIQENEKKSAKKASMKKMSEMSRGPLPPRKSPEQPKTSPESPHIPALKKQYLKRSSNVTLFTHPEKTKEDAENKSGKSKSDPAKKTPHQ